MLKGLAVADLVEGVHTRLVPGKVSIDNMEEHGIFDVGKVEKKMLLISLRDLGL